MPPQAKCHPGCPWLDLAVGYVKLGYVPIPLGPEKRPLVKWGAFEVERPSWRVLYNDWWGAWQRAGGIALICGRPHHLVVVDADSEQSWAWALANLPAVRGTKTRRGGHLHFRHPDRGIIGNRAGDKAVTLAPGVKVDVKGLAGYAVAPYSRHPSGSIYLPLGDWTMPVIELPILPEVIVRQAEDRPPVLRPAPPPRRSSDPERAIAAYLTKIGGIPPEGSESDPAVFRAAVWARENAPGLSESAFVDAIRQWRPEFDDGWIEAKWCSAQGRARQAR